VVERLRSLGAVFVEELLEVPEGATVIFSAHGVSRAVEDEARVRRLTVFNATCPLVTKVHMEVQRYAREGLDVILIGHAGHPEVEGTMGRFDTSFGGRMHLVQTLADVAALEVRDPEHLAFVTQTTLSMDDTAEIVATLRQRFPGLATPRHEDICYATQNRQDAVKKLLEHCDVLLVVGSRSSSNSNRLRELADRAGVPGYLIDGPQDLRAEWLEGKRAVGVTAGASAPEVLVRQVLERSEEHTSELQSLAYFVCRLLLEKKKIAPPRAPLPSPHPCVMISVTCVPVSRGRPRCHGRHCCRPRQRLGQPFLNLYSRRPQTHR